jgi:hypothetical protein
VVSMASLWAYERSLWADLDALDAVERREAADLSRGGGGSGRRGGGRRIEEEQGHSGGGSGRE